MLTVANANNCVPGGLSRLIHIMAIAVPQDKLNNLQTECKEFVKKQARSMVELSALLGRMNQTARIGIWEAPLYYRALQRLYIAALNKERSLYQIQDSPYSLDKRRIQRIGVVVIEPTNTVLQNDINTPAIRYDHIDRCLQERLGCKLSGSEYRGSVAERRGQSWYQCLELKACSQSCDSSICQEHIITSTPHPTPHGQLDSSILHKQTTRDTITVASITGARNMDILPFTLDLGDSKTCCSCYQRRRGFCIKERHRPNRVDTGKRYLPEDNTTILCTGSRPVFHRE